MQPRPGFMSFEPLSAPVQVLPLVQVGGAANGSAGASAPLASAPASVLATALGPASLPAIVPPAPAPVEPPVPLAERLELEPQPSAAAAKPIASARPRATMRARIVPSPRDPGAIAIFTMVTSPARGDL